MKARWAFSPATEARVSEFFTGAVAAPRTLPRLNRVDLELLAGRGARMCDDGTARPFPADRTLANYLEAGGERVDEGEGVVVMGEFVTLHAYGCRLVPHPTVAEVLAQIPIEALTRWPRFFVDTQPARKHAGDACLDGAYHVCVTRLYARSLGEQ